MEKKKTQLRISEDLKKHDDEKEMKNQENNQYID